MFFFSFFFLPLMSVFSLSVSSWSSHYCRLIILLIIQRSHLRCMHSVGSERVNEARLEGKINQTFTPPRVRCVHSCLPLTPLMFRLLALFHSFKPYPPPTFTSLFFSVFFFFSYHLVCLCFVMGSEILQLMFSSCERSGIWNHCQFYSFIERGHW